MVALIFSPPSLTLSTDIKQPEKQGKRSVPKYSLLLKQKFTLIPFPKMTHVLQQNLKVKVLPFKVFIFLQH